MDIRTSRDTKGRKTKSMPSRKTPAAPTAKKVGEASGKSREATPVAASNATATRRAIADAVRKYMAKNYGSLMALSALASGPEVEAMFAEIDRNLVASEQCTARLLAAQDQAAIGMLPVPLPSKEVAKEIEEGARSFFGIVQRALRITSEQQKQAALIQMLSVQVKRQAAEIARLRDELITLKAREEIVLVRAEAAAARAASGSVADLARRIGHLEARQPGQG